MTSVPCIIMAGGRGERMGAAEKGLLAPCGRPLLEEVVSALRGSGACSRIVVATTRRHPGIIELAKRLQVEVLLLPGRGYVGDLRRALAHTGTPALVASSDLHGLTPSLVSWFTTAARERSEPVVDLVVRGEPVGLTLHKTQTGGPWATIESPLPVSDIDTPEDLEEAARGCG